MDAIRRIQRDTNAGSHADRLAINRERPRHFRHDSVCQQGRLGRLFHQGLDDGEGVPAQPGNRAGSPCSAGQAAGCLNQKLLPGVHTQGLVQRVELVQIDIKQRHASG